MPRESIIGGGLDGGGFGSNSGKKPQFKPQSEIYEDNIDAPELSDDAASCLDEYEEAPVQLSAPEHIHSRSSQKEDLFGSDFGSGRGNAKFTSSSQMSGSDIFNTGFGSARGNRNSPKAPPLARKIVSNEKPRISSFGAKNKYGSQSKSWDDDSYDNFTAELDSPTGNPDDIFADGYGADDAERLRLSKTGIVKKREYIPDDKPEIKKSADIFATGIASAPLGNQSPEPVHYASPAQEQVKHTAAAMESEMNPEVQNIQGMQGMQEMTEEPEREKITISSSLALGNTPEREDPLSRLYTDEDNTVQNFEREKLNFGTANNSPLYSGIARNNASDPNSQEYNYDDFFEDEPGVQPASYSNESNSETEYTPSYPGRNVGTPIRIEKEPAVKRKSFMEQDDSDLFG